MKVKEFMTKDIIWAKPNDSVSTIAKLMNDNHIGSVPICDDDENIVGIITDRDIILRSIAWDKDIKTTIVTDIMTTDVTTVSPDTDLWDANKLMADYQIRRLPVVDDNKIVGMLSIGDIYRSSKSDSKEVGHTMECICDKSNNY